jgi:hypothetical protein
MSLAIACWVREIAIITSSKDVEYTKVMLGSLGKLNNTLNTSIPGMSNYKEIQKQNTMNTYKEFSWLFKG